MRNTRKLVRLIQVAIGALLGATQCAPSTSSIPAVSDFQIERYTGTWYEIARLPNRFESGLDSVTANYTALPDGKIRVVNRGFKTEDAEWKEAVGKARFASDTTVGELEVSFFGPFYADYRIIRLDRDYRWAVVTSGRKNFLWFLSRTPQLDDATVSQLTEFSDSHGFSVDELIFPAQPSAE